jgi:hypothetical protein
LPPIGPATNRRSIVLWPSARPELKSRFFTDDTVLSV